MSQVYKRTTIDDFVTDFASLIIETGLPHVILSNNFFLLTARRLGLFQASVYLVRYIWYLI